MHLTAGMKIDGRYVIQNLIGEGGMANVYLATDIILNRTVAVKVLHDQLAKQERFIERFRREAKAVASLVHTNIVEIYDVGQFNNYYFIVMELLEGQTLKDYVKEKGRLSVSETINIMRQVCAGVEVAHRYGIVHRDLKPQNIFIRKDGVIKIMDFGIAYQQDASPLTQTNAVMGSVHYLSPEQARGENASIQTDIYSLGIVMYEMLSGNVPFTGDSAVNIVLRHLREAVPYVREANEHVPQSVENIIIKATAKDKDLRYQSLKEMSRDLITALNVERLNEPRLYLVDKVDTTEPVVGVVKNDGNQTSLTSAIADLGETTSEEPVRDKKKKAMIASGIIIGALVLLTIIVMSLSNGRMTVMPDLANKTLEEAQVILQQSQLKLAQPEEVTSDTVEAGKIISTETPVGDKIKKDTEIKVKVSKGKAVFLENYKGKLLDEVLPMLEAAGITSDKYEIQYQQPVGNQEEGTILDQNKASGQEFLLAKDKLVLTVARYEEFELSDLTGRTQAEAVGYAKQNGLLLQEEDIIYEYSDTVVEGIVIRTNGYWPARTVKRGDKISVTVSKGKKPFEEYSLEELTKLASQSLPEKDYKAKSKEYTDGKIDEAAFKKWLIEELKKVL